MARNYNDMDPSRLTHADPHRQRSFPYPPNREEPLAVGTALIVSSRCPFNSTPRTASLGPPESPPASGCPNRPPTASTEGHGTTGQGHKGGGLQGSNLCPQVSRSGLEGSRQSRSCRPTDRPARVEEVIKDERNGDLLLDQCGSGKRSLVPPSKPSGRRHRRFHYTKKDGSRLNMLPSNDRELFYTAMIETETRRLAEFTNGSKQEYTSASSQNSGLHEDHRRRDSCAPETTLTLEASSTDSEMAVGLKAGRAGGERLDVGRPEIDANGVSRLFSRDARADQACLDVNDHTVVYAEGWNELERRLVKPGNSSSRDWTADPDQMFDNPEISYPPPDSCPASASQPNITLYRSANEGAATKRRANAGWDDFMEKGDLNIRPSTEAVALQCCRTSVLGTSNCTPGGIKNSRLTCVCKGLENPSCEDVSRVNTEVELVGDMDNNCCDDSSHKIVRHDNTEDETRLDEANDMSFGAQCSLQDVSDIGHNNQILDCAKMDMFEVDHKCGVLTPRPKNQVEESLLMNEKLETVPQRTESKKTESGTAVPYKLKPVIDDGTITRRSAGIMMEALKHPDVCESLRDVISLQSEGSHEGQVTPVTSFASENVASMCFSPIQETLSKNEKVANHLIDRVFLPKTPSFQFELPVCRPRLKSVHFEDECDTMKNVSSLGSEKSQTVSGVESISISVVSCSVQTSLPLECVVLTEHIARNKGRRDRPCPDKAVAFHPSKKKIGSVDSLSTGNLEANCGTGTQPPVFAQSQCSSTCTAKTVVSESVQVETPPQGAGQGIQATQVTSPTAKLSQVGITTTSTVDLTKFTRKSQINHLARLSKFLPGVPNATDPVKKNKKLCCDDKRDSHVKTNSLASKKALPPLICRRPSTNQILKKAPNKDGRMAARHAIVSQNKALDVESKKATRNVQKTSRRNVGPVCALPFAGQGKFRDGKPILNQWEKRVSDLGQGRDGHQDNGQTPPRVFPVQKVIGTGDMKRAMPMMAPVRGSNHVTAVSTIDGDDDVIQFSVRLEGVNRDLVNKPLLVKIWPQDNSTRPLYVATTPCRQAASKTPQCPGK